MNTGLVFLDPRLGFSRLHPLTRHLPGCDIEAVPDVLRKNGHFVGGETLQSARNATTLRWKNGKVMITDGPYAETKEYLGGILLLEAKDLDHAIQLMSNHPGVKAGPFEIRPVSDLTDMIRESERRLQRHRDRKHDRPW